MENQSTCIKISLNLIQANQVPVLAADCKGEGLNPTFGQILPPICLKMPHLFYGFNQISITQPYYYNPHTNSVGD